MHIYANKDAAELNWGDRRGSNSQPFESQSNALTN